MDDVNGNLLGSLPRYVPYIPGLWRRDETIDDVLYVVLVPVFGGGTKQFTLFEVPGTL